MSGSWSRRRRTRRSPRRPDPRADATSGLIPRAHGDIGRGGDRIRESRHAAVRGGGRLRRRREEADRRRARAGDQACAAPASSSAAQRLLDLGPQRDRRRLQVVDEQLAGSRAASHPRPRRRAADGESPRARPPRSASRGDRPRRRPRRSRGPRAAGSAPRRTRPGSASGSITSPAPATRQGRGWSCEGTSAPSPAAIERVPRPRRRRAAAPPRRRRCRRRAPRRPGCACSISIRSGRPVPAARAQGGERGRAARSGPSIPGQITSSSSDLAELEPVGEQERAEQRAELVQPVVAPRPDVQAEVELRRSADPPGSVSAHSPLPASRAPRRGARTRRARAPRPERRPAGRAPRALAGPAREGPGLASSRDRASDLRRWAKDRRTSLATDSGGAPARSGAAGAAPSRPAAAA